MPFIGSSENPAQPQEDKEKKIRRKLQQEIVWREVTKGIKGESPEDVKRIKEEIEKRKA